MTMIGCYGSIVCKNDKSEVCKQCSLSIACFELVKENTSRVKASFEVDISKHERRNFQHDVANGKVSKVIPISGKREVLTSYQMEIIENKVFPVKARKLISSLFRKGITGDYIRTLLRAQINPFANSTPVILDVACRLMLRNKLNKRNLRTAFMNLGQSDKTALSQANVVLKSLQLMSVLNCELKLKGKE
jgi:hypothetical protein